MISVRSKGSFSKTTNFLKRAKDVRIGVLERYGEKGVFELASSTPIDSGATAQSWYYRIVDDRKSLRLEFCNRNIVDEVPIAIILQYGHATNNGGYAEGIDYINPALRPLFNELADTAWKEVIGK